MAQASIRLPKSRLFVSITEQADFDKITDKVPACVRTRLDEFLAGPGRRHGTKVYYLKPLCVEIGDELIDQLGRGGIRLFAAENRNTRRYPNRRVARSGGKDAAS